LSWPPALNENSAERVKNLNKEIVKTKMKKYSHQKWARHKKRLHRKRKHLRKLRFAQIYCVSGILLDVLACMILPIFDIRIKILCRKNL
jgi:hypothetical protein